MRVTSGIGTAASSDFCRDRRHRDLEANLDTAFGRGLDGERAADEQRSFAHAPQTTILFRRAGEAATVIGDAEDDTTGPGVEVDGHLTGCGVASDVRQALLRDAVHGELRLRRERW
jgi:hypothetical protein